MRTHVNSLYRMTQFCHFLPELAYFPLQGLSDVGSPLRHVIPTQVHVLLAVVRLQALYLLPMLFAVDKPTAAAEECQHAQHDARPTYLFHNLLQDFLLRFLKDFEADTGGRPQNS